MYNLTSLQRIFNNKKQCVIMKRIYFSSRRIMGGKCRGGIGIRILSVEGLEGVLPIFGPWESGIQITGTGND
jgi:hypothetical protein